MQDILTFKIQHCLTISSSNEALDLLETSSFLTEKSNY